MKRKNSIILHTAMACFLWLMIFCPACLMAQEWWSNPQEVRNFREHMRLLQATPPPIRTAEGWEGDRNHTFEVASDASFNSESVSRVCYTLNGTYLGPYDIGIDAYSMKQRQIDIGKGVPYKIRDIGKNRDTLVTNGKSKQSIRGWDFYTVLEYDSKECLLRLVTLDEVKKALYPDLKEPALFMINKFFITKDEDLYRLDRDFIMKVERVSSTEISPLKDFPPFIIIRIFTHTHHNWHQAQEYKGT